jgi:hypothetical protein
MSNHAKKVKFLRSSTSLMVMMIFLMLGFCPLRNALCSLAGPVSSKIKHKVPEHAKIIVHDDCTASAINKASSFYEHTFNKNLLIFVALLLTVFFVNNDLLTKGRYLQLVNYRCSPNVIPIYLRNHVLLI